jgi:hypothetical protein
MIRSNSLLQIPLKCALRQRKVRYLYKTWHEYLFPIFHPSLQSQFHVAFKGTQRLKYIPNTSVWLFIDSIGSFQPLCLCLFLEGTRCLWLRFFQPGGSLSCSLPVIILAACSTAMNWTTSFIVDRWRPPVETYTFFTHRLCAYCIALEPGTWPITRC